MHEHLLPRAQALGDPLAFRAQLVQAHADGHLALTDMAVVRMRARLQRPQVRHLTEVEHMIYPRALLRLVADAADEEPAEIAAPSQPDGNWIPGELAQQGATLRHDPRRLRRRERPAAHVLCRHRNGIFTRLQGAAARMKDQVRGLHRMRADQVALAE